MEKVLPVLVLQHTRHRAEAGMTVIGVGWVEMVLVLWKAQTRPISFHFHRKTKFVGQKERVVGRPPRDCRYLYY